MGTAELAAVVVGALELALLLSLPVLIASLLAGTVAAAAQSFAQVQDPALSFVPKLAAVALVLFFASDWIGARVAAFAAARLADLPRLLP